VPLILGLRDVMDDPSLLEPEWKRKNVLPAVRDLYDEIWVYGLPQICDPLAGIALPKSVRRKMTYTGYLHRTLPQGTPAHWTLQKIEPPYLLVTTGGGGDGEGLIDWALSAYEHFGDTLPPALFVLGPFMEPSRQEEFLARAAYLPEAAAMVFDAEMERIVDRAAGVVAMGGYNTFCEVLSLDKRALIIPRTRPRLEQFIRASSAANLGLVRMLLEDGARDPRVMADALRALPRQPLPSRVVVPGLLEGLPNVAKLVEPWVQQVDDPSDVPLVAHVA